jgi:putative exosortase-associated protein (TIGR04073 family)
MSRVFRTMSLVSLFVALCMVTAPAAMADDYGNLIANKFASGLANTATGWMELPKNIVNTSQKQNIGLGVTVGLVKGVAHTVGRTVVGAFELATFFIPTPEYIHPRYVWATFDMDTTYGAQP